MGTDCTYSQRAPWVRWWTAQETRLVDDAFILQLLFSYCFLSPFLFDCFLFSYPHPPQVTVPFGYPCSSVGHSWDATPSLTIFSSTCLLLLYLLTYSFIPSCLISPRSWRVWDSSDWPLSNWGKASTKEEEWAEGLPSSYPCTWSICTELSTTPGPCINTKCHVRKRKARDVLHWEWSSGPVNQILATPPSNQGSSAAGSI